jgi:hypothetical protein
MEEITSYVIQTKHQELLSFATSEWNVEREYRLYMQSPDRVLYGYNIGDEVVGCIGIKILEKIMVKLNIFQYPQIIEEKG